jgi:hypothetical protein
MLNGKATVFHTPDLNGGRLTRNLACLFLSIFHSIERQNHVLNFLITKDEEYNYLHALKVITTTLFFLEFE